MAKRILLIEDDELLRQSLAEQLVRQEEFDAADEAGTGAAALAMAAAGHYDIVILDVGLPDMDGRDVCRSLRDAGVRAPIIMLTGADSDRDTVAGLESGANDYVTKPFRLNVLLARLRAHLRQHVQSDDAVFVIGPYTFQPAAKMLSVGDEGRRVRLTEKETAILKYLYRTGGKVVDRETLLHEVWGYQAGVDTHTLETHIYRLRQKMEPRPGEGRVLLTEAGGYRLDL